MKCEFNIFDEDNVAVRSFLSKKYLKIGRIPLFCSKLGSKLINKRFGGTTGNHTIEILEKRIREESCEHIIESKFSAIKRIYEAKDHFFIVSKGYAHVLPKRFIEHKEVIDI